jgi:hypothetical protein
MLAVAKNRLIAIDVSSAVGSLRVARSFAFLCCDSGKESVE